MGSLLERSAAALSLSNGSFSLAFHPNWYHLPLMLAALRRWIMSHRLVLSGVRIGSSHPAAGLDGFRKLSRGQHDFLALLDLKSHWLLTAGVHHS